MKRLSVIAASIVLLSTLSVAMGAAVSASASPAANRVEGGAVTGHGVITAGQKWTLYDDDTFDSYLTCDSQSEGRGGCGASNEDNGVSGICEVLTFGTKAKTFSGDRGDRGKVKGNVTLTFANAGLWGTWDYPSQFTGKYADLAPLGYAFFGAISVKGLVVGTAMLAQGSDPYGAGDC